MEKRYYWMKLKEDFFTTPRIKKLRKVPGGDTFVMIYLKMALLALNSKAVLFYEHIENTFVEEIALKIDEDENSVFITVEFLKKTGLMVEIAEDAYKLVEIEDCIGSETDAAIRQRRSRERRALEAGKKQTTGEIEKKRDNVTATLPSKYENIPKNGGFTENYMEFRDNVTGVSQVGMEHEKKCDNVTKVSHACHGGKTVCDNVTHLSQPCHLDIDIYKEKKKETNVSKEKERTERAFEEQVIDEFIKLVLQNDPFCNVPVTDEQKERWYEPIRKLRVKGYAEKDIIDTMRYALTNDFWKAHVLTPSKFRNKFPQLFLKYKAECKAQRTSFNNFAGRQYDMEQLEMELLQSGTSTKV